jgi:phosphoenolpyruvate-protein kinase (PTS system EI component)
VLAVIARSVAGAQAAGLLVALGGVAAGNPAWTPLWLGLGLDELSMAPPALPAVKAVIRRTPLAAAQALARQALAQPTLAEVEALLGERET